MILIRRQSIVTKQQLKEQRDKIFRRQSIISQDYRTEPSQRSHNIVVLNVRGNFYEVRLNDWFKLPVGKLKNRCKFATLHYSMITLSVFDILDLTCAIYLLSSSCERSACLWIPPNRDYALLILYTVHWFCSKWSRRCGYQIRCNLLENETVSLHIADALIQRDRSGELAIPPVFYSLKAS